MSQERWEVFEVSVFYTWKCSNQTRFEKAIWMLQGINGVAVEVERPRRTYSKMTVVSLGVVAQTLMKCKRCHLVNTSGHAVVGD